MGSERSRSSESDAFVFRTVALHAVYAIAKKIQRSNSKLPAAAAAAALMMKYVMVYDIVEKYMYVQKTFTFT